MFPPRNSQLSIENFALISGYEFTWKWGGQWSLENISIFKGGVAAALYGSAGVNGARVITTKKGSKG